MQAGQNTHSEEAAAATPRQRSPGGRLRRVVVRVARLLAGLVAALVLLLLLLEVDFVLDRVGTWALGNLSPFENAELAVEKTSGGLLSGLHLSHVTLKDSTGHTLASVAGLSGDIGLIPFLRRHIVLSDVRIERPEVFMTQRPDSTWDLAHVLPADTSEGSTRVTIRDLRLESGRLVASFLSGDRDSTLRVHDVTAALDLFETPDNTFRLDSADVLFSPAGSADTVTVSLSASFEDDGLDVPDLVLRSPESRLEATGRLAFGDRLSEFEDLDFSLVAAPLAFRDIQTFVPVLDASATVAGRLRLEGSAETLDVTGDFTFGDGATASIRGIVSPPGSESLTYDLDAALTRVDPDYLLRMTGGSASPVTASLRADLSGPSRSEVSGHIRLEAMPFRYGRIDLARAQIDATFTTGDLGLHASTTVNGATVGVEGSGRPLDDIPSYRALITADRVDVSHFVEGTSYDSDLSGVAWINLRGKDLETMAGSIDLRLRPSSWGNLEVASAESELRIRNGVLNVGFSGSIGDGSISGRGSATYGDVIRYTVESAELYRIDLAALAGDTTASSVSGRISGSGMGFDPRSASAEVNVLLDSTRYGEYLLRAGSATLRLARAQIEASADLRIAGGHVSIEGSARPFEPRAAVELTRARFDSVDVAELTHGRSWETRLSGSVEGGVRFYDGRVAGQLEARIEPSRINEQEILSAHVSAEIQDENLAADLDALIPGGQFGLRAVGRPFDDTPTLEIIDGRVAGVDLSRILADAHLHTDLNATFAATLSGDRLETAVGAGRFDISRSAINSDTLRAGSVIVRADSGTVTIETDARLGEGHVMMVGFAEVVGDRGFELTGTMTNVSPTRLVGADSLTSRVSLDLALSGTRLDLEPSIRGRLDVHASALARIGVQSATTRFSYEDGSLDVDTVLVRSNVGSLDGGGRISLSGDSTSTPSDLVLHAEVRDLGPVGELMPTLGPLLAQGAIEAYVMGTAPDQRVRIDGHFRQIASGDLRVGEVRVRGVGRIGARLEIVNAEGRLEAEQPSLPNIAARTLRVDATYREDLVRFEGHAVVDDQTDGRTSGQIALDGDQPVLSLESLQFGKRTDRWELLTTSSITLGDEYRVSNLLLYSGQQQVALDGYVDFDGEQSLVVSLEGLRIGPVAEFFGYEGLDGVVNGYIDLTGRADAPRILGSLTANIRSLGEPVGDLSLDLDYSDLQVQIGARLRDEAGRSLSGEGRMPIDLRLAIPDDETADVRFGGAAVRGETAVTVSTDGFAIGWIKPFLDPDEYSDVAGQLTGRVELTGTFDDPTLSGSATIVDGRLGLTAFSVTYTDIRVEARFAEDRIDLDHFEATSGRGSLIGYGSVSLADLNLGDFNIDVSTEDFLAIDNREYSAVVAGDLVLTGTTRRPRLDGTVNIVSADIFLVQEIEEFEPVRLSMQDLLTVEQRFGIRLTERDTTTFDFYEAMAMDINVTMARDTWLRSNKNPTMDIQFTGSLDISKLPFQDEQVFGSIQVLPERSRIVQFGKAFAIKKGDLTYNGPIEDPVLDLEAEYAIRAWRNPDDEVTITLSANGRLDELDVELTSDPTMELTDIVSYIAFGRPASESLHLGGSGQGGSLATGLALGQVASLIEGVAGSGLGLDVVEIDQQGLDTRLTAGKYVHSKLYLSISQPLSLGGSTSGSTFGNKREITAEFEMIESLLMRVLSRRGSISVNLLWHHAY